MALGLPRLDQFGQVIDVYDSSWRDTKAAHRFFERRGHYELAVDEPTNRRVAVAFDELVLAV